MLSRVFAVNLADQPKVVDAIDPRVLDDAIRWMVLLRSGDATGRDRARFEDEQREGDWR